MDNVLILIIVVFGSIISLSLLMTYLTFNWWRPFTRIKTNGHQFLIERSNIFYIWQEYEVYSSLSSAYLACQDIAEAWHKDHDEYRFVNDDEFVAHRIEQANKE